MSDLSALRLQLRAAGYSPIPVVGKRAVLKDWPNHFETNAAEIELWDQLYFDARNTGILTKFTPTIDIDIKNPDAAEAVEALAHERFDERGYVLVRIGEAPKRAIPLRTDKPFRKLPVGDVIAPDGNAEKIELLCDGQQLVVAGIHPRTRKPYSWHGGSPDQIKHDDLPYVTEDEARAFVEDAATLLVEQFGYRRKEQAKKENVENGQGAWADWSGFLGNLIDHDALRDFAMSLIRSGMNSGAAVRLLRGHVEALEGVDPDRKQRRLDDIPALVSSARAKISTEVHDVPPVGAAPGDGHQSEAPQPGDLGEWDAGDDPGPIAPRQWLLGNQFCRRFISSMVAPGGGGKSVLRLVQYIALATGRPLTGQHVFRRCRVLLISLEDDREEQQRRIAAVLEHFGVNRSELKGWLLCANPKRAKLAEMKGKVRSVGPLEQQVRNAIERHKVDLVCLDPFIKTHGLEENASGDMDFVVDLLARMAIDYDIAVDSPHHVHKGQMTPGDADSGRGSSGIRDGGRLVYTLVPMSEDEADNFGISSEDRLSYVRLDSAKVNIAPRGGPTTWFHIVGVSIDNGTADIPAATPCKSPSRGRRPTRGPIPRCWPSIWR